MVTASASQIKHKPEQAPFHAGFMEMTMRRGENKAEAAWKSLPAKTTGEIIAAGMFCSRHLEERLSPRGDRAT